MSVILKTILLKLLTQKFLSKVIVLILEALAARTDNKVDDELVKAFKDAVE